MSDSQSGDHGFESRTDYFMSRTGIGYLTNYSEINSPLAGISDPKHMLIFYVYHLMIRINVADHTSTYELQQNVKTAKAKLAAAKKAKQEKSVIDNLQKDVKIAETKLKAAKKALGQ